MEEEEREPVRACTFLGGFHMSPGFECGRCWPYMEVHTSTWLQLSPISICTSARVPVGCQWAAQVYCLYHSFFIVHTEHGQWQASFAWEKSTCLVWVSVTEQILTEISRNFGGTEHVRYQALFFFFAHT